jgi:phage terminase large subunit-like protein
MGARTYTLHAYTWENLGNVDPGWYQDQRDRLRGTQQGREELDGELEADDGSEMFSLSVIDRSRVRTAPTLDRIVVAVDPSGSNNRRSDLAGIVAAGLAGDLQTGEGFMLEDATEKLSWDDWGRKTLLVAEAHGASAIVCETNKFAGAVAANLRTAAAALGYEAQTRPGTKHQLDLVKGSRRVQILEVHARGDKATRAGPVSTLYQRDRVHHVGHWHELEDEMSEFALGAPAHGGSPNRLDALVHAFTELFQLDRAPEPDYEATNRGYGQLVNELRGGAPRAETSSSGLSGTLAQLMSAHRSRRI